jgi:ATP-binding cassette subfamily B protein
MKRPFPHYTQPTPWTAYATCLRMIAKFYGKTYSNQFLRERSFITREGVSLLGISEAEYLQIIILGLLRWR